MQFDIYRIIEDTLQSLSSAISSILSMENKIAETINQFQGKE